MCGIVGVWVGKPEAFPSLSSIASDMADSIRHRGPDDVGVWDDPQLGIALGHRRLSIVDLSSTGHQPMASASDRYVITFNGEIYNHSELRLELQEAGAVFAWRGHSDTETLLAAIEHWGIESTLTKTIGMFAIALWDARERTLHLARDRFGEKPLYYGWVGGGAGGAFVFGSELKALRTFPGFANPVCRQALAQYMRFMYVPAPRSIYQGIYKLEPGCLLSITGGMPSTPSLPLRPTVTQGALRMRRWWSLAEVVQAGAQNPITDEDEAVLALQDSLQSAIRLQSQADVPLGAFLSGGVDSSAIVALMQQQAARSVKTFTVGFEEEEFDESAPARAVAQHLGTDHTELFVTAAEAQAIIPRLPAMYDEPFADSSQIPTHLVCRAARQHVTVALSGDAGDELFGGYNRYFWGPLIWNRLASLPYPVRQAVCAFVGAVPLAGWNTLSGLMNVQHPAEKLHKLAQAMRGVRNLDELYLGLVSVWSDPDRLLRRESDVVPEPQSLLADPLPTAGAEQPQLRMMYHDTMTYLPDDILCKVDRAAMAVGLETRVPFLDHRVAELAWRLPLSMKIHGGQGKWVLRQLLYKSVPRELIERPKTGFGIPVGQWLRGPLRGWAENMLEEPRLEREGYLNPKPIREIWRQHLSGRCDWTSKLWSVLMFQAWLEANS
jgi:asparagine synthase (glutamine-hydrolysing)